MAKIILSRLLPIPFLTTMVSITAIIYELNSKIPTHINDFIFDKVTYLLLITIDNDVLKKSI